MTEDKEATLEDVFAENKNAKMTVGGVVLVFTMWYLNLMYKSSQRWFHIAWLTMLIYTGYQMYLFFQS
jgi:hypothetical protein